jgi:hypothetical protein
MGKLQWTSGCSTLFDRKWSGCARSTFGNLEVVEYLESKGAGKK